MTTRILTVSLSGSGQQDYRGDGTMQQYGGQGADPNQQYAGNPTDPNNAQEGDRGMMGAIGGGVAGYAGGSKLGGHGILGAIAGAIAGSKLEDAAKDHHKHKKDGYSQSGGSQGSGSMW